MSRSSVIQAKGLIDTHHHFFPPSLPELASEFTGISPSLPFIFPKTIDDHLQFMDTAGIQTVIISPSIRKDWGLEWTAPRYLKLCEDALEAAFDMVKQNPLRFGTFALLPLPHVNESIQLITSSQSGTIRPDGYAVATASGDKYIGDKSFDPVWEELNKINATVFVHPSDTVMPPNLQFQPFLLEYPFDTTRAIVSAITSGILTRYPNVRFIFSHLGGAFGFLADRINPMDAAVRQANAGRNMTELLQSANIFLDTAISAPKQYSIIKQLGFQTSHLIHATDFPYTGGAVQAYGAGINSPANSGVFTHSEVYDDIGRENALNLLFPRLKREYAMEFK